MKKMIQGRIAATITIALLTSCELPQGITLPATNAANPVPTSTPVPTPTTTPIPTPTPNKSDALSVVIRKSTYFDSAELAKLERARAALQKVLNSDEFKQKVLHFKYQGSETYVQNDGYTNQEIYNLIQAGAEQYPRSTTANHIMDLYVELYYEASNVIGYTDPSTSTIYMNSYFFDDASVADIAGNMMHEWLHKLGFDHDYDATTRRPYSVPYAVGYLAEDLVAKAL